MTSTAIVQKLWNYCNVLRDDGMIYGDYVEQLKYLLFLKMTDERTKPIQSAECYAGAFGAKNPENSERFHETTSSSQ